MIRALLKRWKARQEAARREVARIQAQTRRIASGESDVCADLIKMPPRRAEQPGTSWLYPKGRRQWTT